MKYNQLLEYHQCKLVTNGKGKSDIIVLTQRSKWHFDQNAILDKYFHITSDGSLVIRESNCAYVITPGAHSQKIEFKDTVAHRKVMIKNQVDIRVETKNKDQFSIEYAGP